MAKKLFIKTFGCQMNVYDSARMEDALSEAGFDISAVIMADVPDRECTGFIIAQARQSSQRVR